MYTWRVRGHESKEHEVIFLYCGEISFLCVCLTTRLLLGNQLSLDFALLVEKSVLLLINILNTYNNAKKLWVTQQCITQAMTDERDLMVLLMYSKGHEITLYYTSERTPCQSHPAGGCDKYRGDLVNLIRSRTLNHKEFSAFLTKNGGQYGDVIYPSALA